MVKRTLLVLGILSLTVMAAGSCFAFFGGGAGATFGVGGAWGPSCEAPKPMYVPVDCCPYPVSKTIIKTWSAKIVGPCPPPALAGCGTGGCGTKGLGLMGGLCATLISPCDILFGGCDGVYGCGPNLGMGGGPCGPCYGPVACAVAGPLMCLASPTTMFGALW
ncbi:MAG: hypothetical protein P8182_03030 [Deltaproteobacteria bacterium]